MINSLVMIKHHPRAFIDNFLFILFKIKLYHKEAIDNIHQFKTTRRLP